MGPHQLRLLRLLLRLLELLLEELLLLRRWLRVDGDRGEQQQRK